jgi:alkane 1-monooxygenase
LKQNKATIYAHDGSIVEGTGIGGKVLIVSKEPQFIRDVCPYFAPSMIIVSSHFLYMYTGNLCLAIWMMFLACPISNYLLPEDNQNLSAKSEKAFFNDKRFWIPLYVFNFLETMTWIWALIVYSDKVNINMYWFQLRPTTFYEHFIFTFTMGYFCGVNAINGHELLHKKEWYNKYLGTWCYTKFMYSHFLDEHIKGHHKFVATPEDPATAHKNENVYHFIVRSAIGSHTNTWAREERRIKKTHGEDASLLTIFLNSKMTVYFLIHATIVSLIYILLGWNSVKYQIVYTLWGIFFLELINYIEHYGILRLKDEQGVYESITKMHSWNSLSSPVLFRLQRHSDHHSHAFRPYQILRRMDEAPFHPFEYLHSLVMCLVPPLWYYLVNPRVEALRDHVMGKKGNKTCFDYISPFTPEDKRA